MIDSGKMLGNRRSVSSAKGVSGKLLRGFESLTLRHSHHIDSCFITIFTQINYAAPHRPPHYPLLERIHIFTNATSNPVSACNSSLNKKADIKFPIRSTKADIKLGCCYSLLSTRSGQIGFFMYYVKYPHTVLLNTNLANTHGSMFRSPLQC